ncbi:transcriptional regulator [Agrobacterium deltaense]|uniref:ArsR/SmtB family transcription factor n=1 Tax=Agrobacterium TaxID=357 RepID=UPI0009EB7011|nr:MULTISPECIES: metalloregulator ArsR/SmtB family transcription factor [Agrobacterium]RKF41838.1 transcriptional regulator [Agrobacterium deltaense]
MNEQQILDAFGALSQQTRLRVLKKLVIAGPAGLAAGAIADAVNVSASNISFHLKELEHAGLIAARREARSIVYSADFEALRPLARFMMENCCVGEKFDCSTEPKPGQHLPSVGKTIQVS